MYNSSRVWPEAWYDTCVYGVHKEDMGGGSGAAVRCTTHALVLDEAIAGSTLIPCHPPVSNSISCLSTTKN